MFNTNVTTEQPPEDAKYSYSVISNSHQGVGFSYGGFPTTDPRAYNPSGDARIRRSGLAHEVGHNFGLQHQSDYDLFGQKVYEYTYGYDGLHGAIMGVDYAQSVHKWYIGHPSDSPSDLQDDVAQIAGKIKPFTNGGDGMRPDDYPTPWRRRWHPPARRERTAHPASSSGSPTPTAFRSLRRAGRRRSTWCRPTRRCSTPSWSCTGRTASWSRRRTAPTNDQHLATPYLPAGTYVVTVRSHGDYADLGQYDLTVHTSTGVAPAGTYNALPAPAGVRATAVAGPGVAVSWGAVTGCRRLHGRAQQ